MTQIEDMPVTSQMLDRETCGQIHNPAEISRYEFNVGDVPYTVVIANSTDTRCLAARDIEVDTFTELGDKPDEVREEFVAYEPESIYLFVHKTQDTSAETDASQLVGMGRLIPRSTMLGVKTFNDLGEIAASTPIAGVRNRILAAVGLSECVEAPDLPGCGSSEVTERVLELFSEMYQCADVNKIIDIATLAPDMNMDNVTRFETIQALLNGMALYTTGLFQENKLTHLVQFTSVSFHDLLEVAGLPVHKIFGLEKIQYDSFGNGEVGENMIATPSYLALNELLEAYFKPGNVLLKPLAETLVRQYGEGIATIKR